MLLLAGAGFSACLGVVGYFYGKREEHMAQLPSQLHQDAKNFFSLNPFYYYRLSKLPIEQQKEIIQNVALGALADVPALDQSTGKVVFFEYSLLRAVSLGIYCAACCAQNDFWEKREVTIQIKQEEVTNLALAASDEFKTCMKKIRETAFLNFFSQGTHWFVNTVNWCIYNDSLNGIELSQNLDSIKMLDEYVSYLASLAPHQTQNMVKLNTITKQFFNLFKSENNPCLPMSVHVEAMKHLNTWINQIKKDAEPIAVKLYETRFLPRIESM